MRLLHTSTFETKIFPDGETPPYAILSHTWGQEEITYADLQDLHSTDVTGKEGFEKIKSSCRIANADDFDYIWIDTCCIDKPSKSDLTEIASAINSMYQWYSEARICYAYLADFESRKDIWNSQWFTRGHMVFLNKHWTPLGTKGSLQSGLSARTHIPVDVLSGTADMESISVAQRMAWAAGRQTTRVEDRAYSLLGLFGISMPLLYGEGHTAFIRLQEGIIKVSDDESIFAWKSAEWKDYKGFLATSPGDFSRSRLQVELRFFAAGDHGAGLAILNCTRLGQKDHFIAIYVADRFLTLDRFVRVECSELNYPPRLLTFRHRRLAGMNMPEVQNHKQLFVQPMVPGDKSSAPPRSPPSPLSPQIQHVDYGGLLLGAVKKSDAYGREDLVRMLLGISDINPDEPDKSGFTPICLAAVSGHPNVVDLLIAHGVDVDSSSNGISIDVARLLVDRGAYVSSLKLIYLYMRRLGGGQSSP
ncbi:heterokaryon incompatibility protein-domain-containing protein [Aspergillus bertholletiae]|uniref:Heterokaryon incompatibility protein-domain-containing protein n=1 Tax=Aspergillus bertholletiae TaxID=1226010 RepID=A0A5N7B3W3_9EURO|nr:heterokaryon incompatibility protein-domain-containing protein [Aspergillus bertholletiae]